jgi:hypothetical protein
MARRDVTIARDQRTGCFIVYNHAKSDRTLARMTHMLTSSSRSASKDFEGRATEMPRELEARI